MSYLNIKNLNRSYATNFGKLGNSEGSCRLRLELNGSDNKTKIVAKVGFITLIECIEKLLYTCFKRERKWTRVFVENGSKTVPILLNIKSLCRRTLITRQDVLSKSAEELSQLLTNSAYTSWEYKKLNDLFPHITMINLDHRTDRMESFKEHITLIGESNLQYNRLSATDAKTLPAADVEKMSKSDYATHTGKDDRAGRYAGFLSHLNALKDAKARGLRYVLILEDDVRFASQDLTGLDLQKTFNELPSDWGVWFLGYQELSPEKAKNHSEHLTQPGCPYDLHAYAVNSSMYDQFIAILEAELQKTNGQMRPVDVVVAEDIAQKLASNKIVFGCKTNVAFQDNGYSSILDTTYTNYKTNVRNYRSKYDLDRSTRTATGDGLPIMSPKIAGALYQMAYHATQVFDNHNIRYWADRGTVLGMVRHGGLIPHDDDIDFAIFPEDLDKLKNPQLIADLKAVGLEIVDHWLGAKICPIAPHPEGCNMSLDGYQFRTPNIDLFFTEAKTINNELCYVYKTQKAAKIWPHFIYKHNDIFDANDTIRKGKFGPLQVNTLSPQGSVEFCKRIYGKNCLAEIYMQYDHIHERGIKPRPYQMTDYRLGTHEHWDKLGKIPATA